MGEKVVRVDTNEEKVCSVVTRDAQGVERKYEGDYFLSSMPIKDLAEAIGKDHMPEVAYDVAVRLPYRDFITVGLLLERLSVKIRRR